MDVGIGISAQAGLSAAFNGIITTALCATLDAQEHDRLPLRAVFRQAVETYIADHLMEPGLGPDLLATRFRVSRRTLYGLFEEAPHSVSGLIRELRLQHSARNLCSPGHPGVLAAALHWGFNDASHFRDFSNSVSVCPRVGS